MIGLGFRYRFGIWFFRADRCPSFLHPADIKTRLGLTNTDFDEIINSIITGIDGMFESYCQPAAAYDRRGCD